MHHVVAQVRGLLWFMAMQAEVPAGPGRQIDTPHLPTGARPSRYAIGHRAFLSLLRSVKSIDGQLPQVEDTLPGEMMHETAFDSVMGSPYCAPRSHLQSEL